MARRTVKPAAKPIKAVFAEFLADQHKRLKPKTVSQCERVLELFEASLDGYAYQNLDDDETALWEELYNASGPNHREFCQIFGPEKIPENVGEFLGYFMPHKVICGQDLLRAAGRVTKKLGKWLSDKGYVESDSADFMADRGARASKDLPAAEALSQVLAAHAATTTGAVTKRVEGYFEVRSVSDTSLDLEQIAGRAKMTVPVPPRAAKACKPGWTICGCVGRSARGWRLLEVWNVYTLA